MKKKTKLVAQKKKLPFKQKEVVQKIKVVILEGADRAGHPLTEEACANITRYLVRKHPSRRNLLKEFNHISLAFGGHPSLVTAVDFSDLDMQLEPVRQAAVSFPGWDPDLDRIDNPKS